MESLMAKVIQQMKVTDVGDFQKEEIGVRLRARTLDNSQLPESDETDSRSTRTSSFSILRSNVLQYVENGEWNSQPLKTNACISANSHEKNSVEEDTNPARTKDGDTTDEKKSDAVVAARCSDQWFPIESSEIPETLAVSELSGEDFHVTSSSDSKRISCVQDTESNDGKREKRQKCRSSDDAILSRGQGKCLDYSNVPEFTVVPKFLSLDNLSSSQESSTNSLTSSCESVFGSTGELSLSDEDLLIEESSEEFPNTAGIKHKLPFDSDKETMEETSENADNSYHMNSDIADDSSLRNFYVDTCSFSDSEGLSTYTLHHRWNEVLPEEIIRRITKEDGSKEKCLFHDFQEEKNCASFGPHFINSQLGVLSEGKAGEKAGDIMTVRYSRIKECSSEFCYNFGMEETDDDRHKVSLFEENKRCDAVKGSYPSNSENSFRSSHEPSSKSSSIQDAYRNILKTISNVGDGSTMSPPVGRKARHSRRAKKKPKSRPVYVCSKCQSSYFVSSKKAIAISRCLRCDLWTSENATEEEGQEAEVSASFCCLS